MVHKGFAWMRVLNETGVGRSTCLCTLWLLWFLLKIPPVVLSGSFAIKWLCVKCISHHNCLVNVSIQKLKLILYLVGKMCVCWGVVQYLMITLLQLRIWINVRQKFGLLDHCIGNCDLVDRLSIKYLSLRCRKFWGLLFNRICKWWGKSFLRICVFRLYCITMTFLLGDAMHSAVLVIVNLSVCLYTRGLCPCGSN